MLWSPLNTDILPSSDNAIDLGSATKQIKDGHFAGSVKRNTNSLAYELVSSVVISNDANIDFEETELFDGTYSKIIFEIEELVPATDGNNLDILFKVGGSYVTSGYQFVREQMNASDANDTYNSVTNQADSEIRMIAGVGNDTGESAAGTLTIRNPSSSSLYKMGSMDAHVMNAGGNLEFGRGIFAYTGGTGALQGVRVQMNTGNLSSGIVSAYGVLDS